VGGHGAGPRAITCNQRLSTATYWREPRVANRGIVWHRSGILIYAWILPVASAIPSVLAKVARTSHPNARTTHQGWSRPGNRPGSRQLHRPPPCHFLSFVFSSDPRGDVITLRPASAAFAESPKLDKPDRLVGESWGWPGSWSAEAGGAWPPWPSKGARCGVS